MTEAAIVMPVVIFSLIAIFYMSMLLYQQVYIQRIADEAAERGSALNYDFTEEGLYSELYDTNSKNKTERVYKYIDSNLYTKNLMIAVEHKTDVEIKDYIVYKKIVVKIESTYNIPAGRILSIFGIGDSITLKAQSESVVDNPVQLIRNTDLIIDIISELEEKYPWIRDVSEKIGGTFSEIKNSIDKYFEK